MQRIETHIIKSNKPIYKELVEMCQYSKNLYNYTLYIYRQAFTGKHENIEEYKDLIRNERFVSSYDIVNKMKELNQIDFRSVRSNVNQQVVYQVDTIWKAWFKALKSYQKTPSKFKGKPKMPKYLDKNGLNILIFTTAAAKLKNGKINLTKHLKLPITTKIEKFQQVRIVPRNGYIKVEIVYNKEIKDENLNSEKAIGIDIGINNLCTITSNDGKICNIINGRPLKSINQFYNKSLARIKSINDKKNIKTSKRIKRLNFKRQCKIDDYLHKASRKVVEIMSRNKIKYCFIGHNDGWKQECNMGRFNNQKFIQIPFNRLIEMIKYKAEEIGGVVLTINESHTSKCSFLDSEEVKHHDEYVGCRKSRGLFKSKLKDKVVNADVNGSLNILKRGIGFEFAFNKTFYNPQTIQMQPLSLSNKINGRGYSGIASSKKLLLKKNSIRNN